MRSAGQRPVLRSAGGASITVNESGIYISNGQGATLFMVGNTVTVNGGALVVLQLKQ